MIILIFDKRLLRLICFIAKRNKRIKYSIHKLVGFCIDIFTVNIVCEIILESMVSTEENINDINIWLNNHYTANNIDALELIEEDERLRKENNNSINSSRKRLKRFHSSDSKVAQNNSFVICKRTGLLN